MSEEGETKSTTPRSDMGQAVFTTVDRLIEDIKRGNFVSEYCNSIGLQFIGTWNFVQAEQIFRALLEKEGDINRGRNLNNLGLALKYQGKTEEAKKAFEEAYEWDKKQVGSIEKAQTLPAYQNLKILEKNISFKIRNGSAVDSEFSELFHKDILAGGIIGGLILFLLQDTFLYLQLNIFNRIIISLSGLAIVWAIISRYLIRKNSKS